MAFDHKKGLSPTALGQLLNRIDPATVAHTAVSGEYWPVYLRPHTGSEEQTALGVVLKFAQPPMGMLWRMANPEIVRDFYSDATLEQWRWMMAEVEEALADGDENSPIPNSIVYGNHLPFQGRSPERALEVLFESVTGLGMGILARKNHGGFADNPEQTTSELLRSVTTQLGLASKVVEQYGRATIYKVDHHLVTTLDLAPTESCERHSSDILTAAGKMASKRRGKESMAVCTLCTPDAEQTAAELIARLKSLDVSFISDEHPAKLRLMMEALLAGGQKALDL